MRPSCHSPLISFSIAIVPISEASYVTLSPSETKIPLAGRNSQNQSRLYVVCLEASQSVIQISVGSLLNSEVTWSFVGSIHWLALLPRSLPRYVFPALSLWPRRLPSVVHFDCDPCSLLVSSSGNGARSSLFCGSSSTQYLASCFFALSAM